MFGSTASNSGGGLFGANSNNNSLFGASKPAGSTGFSFGGNNQSTNPSNNTTTNTLGANKTGFGNTSGSGTGFGNSVTGGATGFGTNTTTNTSGFGTNSTNTNSNTGFGFGSNTANTSNLGFASNNTNSLFGASKPATGLLFGNNTTTNTTNTSGGLFGSKPAAPSGGLFGNTTANTNSSSGGLFGNNTNSSSNNTSGGLFGAKPTTTSSGGLFGSSTTGNTSGGLFGGNTNTSGTQQSGGGLFGGNTNTGGTQQSGGLFGGNANNSGTQQSGGLFGNNQQSQSGGLFGSNSNNNQQQPQQQTQGSLFGNNNINNAQPSFNWNSAKPNTNTNTSNTNTIGNMNPNLNSQQNTNINTYAPAINDQLLKVKEQWDPSSSKCVLKTHFYNKFNEQEVSQLMNQPRPNDETPEDWDKAMLARPSPLYFPVKVSSFDDVASRVETQIDHVAKSRILLNNIYEKQQQLSSKHDLDNTTRILKAKARHTKLSRRLLRLATVLAIIKLKGYPLLPEEEEISKQFDILNAKISDPNSSIGKLNDIFARVAILKDRADDLNTQFDNSINMMNQTINQNQKVEPTSDAKDGNTDEIINKLSKVLLKQQIGLNYLNEILNKDTETINSLTR